MINITTNVIYADMPPTIKAYTVNNNDDSFTIVLNSRLNREQHHELTHIENGDYDRQCKDVDMIEIYAHNIN